MSTHTPPVPPEYDVQVTPMFNTTGRRPLIWWRPTCTHGHHPQSPYPPCRQKPVGWHGVVIDLDGKGPRPVLEPTCAEHHGSDYGDAIAIQYGIRLHPPQWAPTREKEA